MNRNLLYIAVPALIASVSLGCAKPTVVGKWQGNVPISGQSIAATIEYKADGTTVQTATTPFGPLTVSGTYKVEGDTITSTINDIKVGARSLPVPAGQKTNSAQYKLDGDSLTMSLSGKDAVLTRVKDEAAK